MRAFDVAAPLELETEDVLEERDRLLQIGNGQGDVIDTAIRRSRRLDDFSCTLIGRSVAGHLIHSSPCMRVSRKPPIQRRPCMSRCQRGWTMCRSAQHTSLIVAMQSLIEEKTIRLVHKNVRRCLYTVTQYSFVGSSHPCAGSGTRQRRDSRGCSHARRVLHRMAMPVE